MLVCFRPCYVRLGIVKDYTITRDHCKDAIESMIYSLYNIEIEGLCTPNSRIRKRVRKIHYTGHTILMLFYSMNE